MALRSIFVAMLGVAVAGGSAYVARDYLAAQSAAAKPDPGAELIQVLVAAQDIPFGEPIERQMLRFQPWPRGAVPVGAFTALDKLVPAAGEQPRRARFAMAQGQLILASQVSGFGEKVTLVQSLAPNARAMAIKVDAVTAVGGFVTPGDRVDILLTQGHDTELRTVTILQNIRVLGVDQDSNQQTDTTNVAKTVTVEVTAPQSQALALGQKAGSLSLTLRAPDKLGDKPLDATTLGDVIREKSPVPDPKPTRYITVNRGLVATKVEIN